MTRQTIRERFRQENPDITERTISDDILNTWINVGQQEMAFECQFIVEDLSFTTVSTQISYDLTILSSKFANIDDRTSGIFYNNKYLLSSSPSQLANGNIYFKDNTSGTPKYWYRRKNLLTLDKYPESSKTLTVPCVLYPDDMTDDADIPFDGLTYLSHLHYGLTAYLTWKAKIKLGKKDEALTVRQEYEIYIAKGKSVINSNRLGSISLNPVSGVYANSGVMRR